jgi:outer membrane protein TolC
MKRLYLFMIFSVFFTLFSASKISALTLDDALRLAGENNHLIKEYKNLSDAEKERIGSAASAFMPEVGIGYSYAQSDEALPFQTKKTSTFTAEASYNLFKGLSDLNSLKSARSMHDAALYRQNGVFEDVALEVKLAYIEVLRAARRLETAKEAVELLQRQRRDAELYFREGLTARNELLKVEVELASSKQQLLQAEAGLTVARSSLERVIGAVLPPDERIEEVEGEKKTLSIEEDRLVEEMLQRRSELKYLMAEKAALMRKRDSIKGGFFPSVDISLTHERYGDSFAPDGRQDLPDAETRGMVIASWSIFDGFKKRHDIRAEEAGIRAIEERIKDTEEALRLELKRAAEGYRVSLGRLAVAEKAVEQALENYRITENQFKQRIATQTDMLDARFFLTRARDEKNNAVYDIDGSIAKLERVVERRL